MTERKNSSSRNWRGEGPERSRNPSGRRSPSGATKSQFPAEARYWGRVNSQGDFEEAPGFPAPRFQFPWRALGRALRGLVPNLSSALIGALSALAFQAILAQPTGTATQPAPTIIVNPAPVVAAPAVTAPAQVALAPAPVAVVPKPEPVVEVAPAITPAPRPRAAAPRVVRPSRPLPIRNTVAPVHAAPKPASVRQTDPDAILEPSF
jgi:hypothetical protein